MAKCLLLTQSGHQHAVAQAVEEPLNFMRRLFVTSLLQAPKLRAVCTERHLRHFRFPDHRPSTQTSAAPTSTWHASVWTIVS